MLVMERLVVFPLPPLPIDLTLPVELDREDVNVGRWLAVVSLGRRGNSGGDGMPVLTSNPPPGSCRRYVSVLLPRHAVICRWTYLLPRR